MYTKCGIIMLAVLMGGCETVKSQKRNSALSVEPPVEARLVRRAVRKKPGPLSDFQQKNRNPIFHSRILQLRQLHEGIRAYEQFDYRKSVAVCQRIARQRNASTEMQTEALFYCGASHWLLGDKAEAIQLFKQTRQLLPGYTPDTHIFKPAIITVFRRAR